MASPTQCTWVWVNSGSWWWTGRPGVLRFMGSQKVRHDWGTELKRVILPLIWFLRCCYKLWRFWYSVHSWLYELSMHARIVVSSISCPLISGSIPNWDNLHMFPPSNFFSENFCNWIETLYQGCYIFYLVTWTPLAVCWNSSEWRSKCIN